MTTDPQSYRRALMHPVKYRFYMLWRLPSLIFWGVKVSNINETTSTVTMKHRWTNQNPFGSIYFSALNGAAELSTGILVQAAIQGKNPFSMLVVESKASFYKKAKGIITFKCSQGDEVQNTIDALNSEGGDSTLWLSSKATNEAGELIGEFAFKWALKKK